MCLNSYSGYSRSARRIVLLVSCFVLGSMSLSAWQNPVRGLFSAPMEREEPATEIPGDAIVEVTSEVTEQPQPTISEPVPTESSESLVQPKSKVEAKLATATDTKKSVAKVDVSLLQEASELIGAQKATIAERDSTIDKLTGWHGGLFVTGLYDANDEDFGFGLGAIVRKDRFFGLGQVDFRPYDDVTDPGFKNLSYSVSVGWELF